MDDVDDDNGMDAWINTKRAAATASSLLSLSLLSLVFLIQSPLACDALRVAFVVGFCLGSS